MAASRLEGARLQACRQTATDEVALAAEGPRGSNEYPAPVLAEGWEKQVSRRLKPARNHKHKNIDGVPKGAPHLLRTHAGRHSPLLLPCSAAVRAGAGGHRSLLLAGQRAHLSAGREAHHLRLQPQRQLAGVPRLSRERRRQVLQPDAGAPRLWRARPGDAQAGAHLAGKISCLETPHLGLVPRLHSRPVLTRLAPQNPPVGDGQERKETRTEGRNLRSSPHP